MALILAIWVMESGNLVRVKASTNFEYLRFPVDRLSSATSNFPHLGDRKLGLLRGIGIKVLAPSHRKIRLALSKSERMVRHSNTFVFAISNLLRERNLPYDMVLVRKTACGHCLSHDSTS